MPPGRASPRKNISARLPNRALYRTVTFEFATHLNVGAIQIDDVVAQAVLRFWLSSSKDSARQLITARDSDRESVFQQGEELLGTPRLVSVAC
jgi:hypothetical protein